MTDLDRTRLPLCADTVEKLDVLAADPPIQIFGRSRCGMEVAEAKRLKALEDENGRLKRLLADAMLDVSTLKEMLAKNF
jgi:hypothetical protein